jgi:hypothetical protein
MDEADRLLAANDLEGALKRYQAADDLMHVPTTGIETARVLAQLGKLVEARTRAIEVAHSPVTAGEPEVFAEARARAVELAEALGSRIPSVVIQVTPSTTGSVVKLDNAAIPQAALGLPFKVNPGQHSLSVSAPGFEPGQQTFRIAEGQTQALSLSLSPAPNSAPSNAAPAAADVAASPDGGAEPAGNPAFTRGVIALGVAGAGLGVGAVAGILTLGSVKSAKAHCDGNDCGPAAQSKVDSARTTALIADIGFGVGVVALGYGLFELIFNQPEAAVSATAQTKRDAAPITSFNVAVLPNSFALNLKGEF